VFAFREAGTQVSPVTMSCPSLRTAVPPCLPLGIRGPLKECLRLLLVAFGFYLGLWAFWYGKLLEGKRITEGKRMTKEGLIESLHEEL
jgi:hypothetical protein